MPDSSTITEKEREKGIPESPSSPSPLGIDSGPDRTAELRGAQPSSRHSAPDPDEWRASLPQRHPPKETPSENPYRKKPRKQGPPNSKPRYTHDDEWKEHRERCWEKAAAKEREERQARKTVENVQEAAQADVQADVQAFLKNFDTYPDDPLPKNDPYQDEPDIFDDNLEGQEARRRAVNG
jgi:hypothetical protein